MTPSLPAPNLALIGFMGSGKTSVGRALGGRIGLRFFDLDEILEAQEGMSVEGIFRARGEPYFRARETALFGRLCGGRDQIIGCGGGTLLDPGNRTLLRDRCYSIWLRASLAEILRRVEAPGAPVRPLLLGSERDRVVRDLLHRRQPLYERADLVVDTDAREVEQVVEEILDRTGIREGPCG
ncbi:MAG: shikimate kinase [Candidatus Eisenbacteria bacterium]|nr:shikimate kinase [Candidatus Latescibacterota bacterium]MBD3301638.1 shikimate kinase [Candidatus Eisenbacteria bacterium]